MYSNEQVPVTNPGQLPPMQQHQEWISSFLERLVK